ncbi:MAG: alpha/beta hydrolase [Acutalibacteraceae bacterium]
MKKLLSVILASLICLSVLPFGAFAANEETGVYPVENRYSQKGSHEVSTVIYDSGEKDYKHYKIWYPTDLETSTDTYPVIVYCNGTGCTYDTVKETMEHFTSWGFVVVSNDHKNSGNGDSASKGLDFLLSLNENSESIFYQKINTEAIGINGHSQGGSATINATSNGKYENSGMYKSLCAVSAPHSELAASAWQKTPYDVSKVEIPSFLIGGTGAVDAGTKTSSGICPLGMSLITNMKAINNENVIIGRIKNSDHGNTLILSTAYITAWFTWTLLNDSFAGTAFVGEDAEIFTNDKWQDVYNKQSENLPENPDPYDPEAVEETPLNKLVAKISKLVVKIKAAFAKIAEFFKSLFR